MRTTVRALITVYRARLLTDVFSELKRTMESVVRTLYFRVSEFPPPIVEFIRHMRNVENQHVNMPRSRVSLLFSAILLAFKGVDVLRHGERLA